MQYENKNNGRHFPGVYFLMVPKVKIKQNNVTKSQLIDQIALSYEPNTKP
jgi:hypothetical protein